MKPLFCKALRRPSVKLFNRFENAGRGTFLQQRQATMCQVSRRIHRFTATLRLCRNPLFAIALQPMQEYVRAEKIKRKHNGINSNG